MRSSGRAGLALAGVIIWACASPASEGATDSGALSSPDAGMAGDDAGAPVEDAGAPGDDAGLEPMDAGSADGGMPDGGVEYLPDASIAYNVDGPQSYTTQTVQVTNGSSTFTVTSYVPSTPGPHPVVSFSCGTNQTAAGYVPYGKRLASYGIAMFLMDDPGVLVNTSDIVPNDVYLVTTWIPDHFGAAIDLTRVGLAGHSRGGGVSLVAAETGLKGKVNAWFGLDAVDNEFLMNPRQFARTDLPNIGIPTAFLGAEIGGNCAPVADGYLTLFPLAPQPKHEIVALGASHTQVQVPSGCTACAVCTPNGTADSNVVLAYSVRYLTAFFARELLGDTAVGAQFEGAGGPADVAAGRVTIR